MCMQDNTYECNKCLAKVSEIARNQFWYILLYCGKLLSKTNLKNLFQILEFCRPSPRIVSNILPATERNPFLSTLTLFSPRIVSNILPATERNPFLSTLILFSPRIISNILPATERNPFLSTLTLSGTRYLLSVVVVCCGISDDVSGLQYRVPRVSRLAAIFREE
jgi:hypothetical protein